MESVKNVRDVFRRITELHKELQSIDSELFQKFKNQISDISDLEDYNFRKIVTDDNFKPIDTLGMRRAIINKWENVISNNKTLIVAK